MAAPASRIEQCVRRSDFMNRGEVVNGKNNGIGLSNVKRRLELQYGDENYELTTESDNSYFSINLKLFDE